MILASDYGVVGDGITDSTGPLLNAVNAAISAKDELMLPAGTILSDPLVVLSASGFRMRAQIFGATILKKRTLAVEGAVVRFRSCTDSFLEDLIVDGNAPSSVVSGVNPGVVVEGVRNFQLRRTRIQNTEGYSFYSQGGTLPGGLVENNDVLLEDMVLRDGSVFQLTEGVNQRWHIHRSSFGDVRDGAEGLRASLKDSKITECFVWCKTGIAMTIKDPRNIIANNHIYAVEMQNAVGIEFGEGADSIQVVGNYIKVGSGGGIPVAIIFQPGSWVYRGTTITGNTIDSRDNHIAVSGSAQVEGVKACGNVYLNNGANVSPPKVSPEILIAP